ncbi:TlpA family protein disulfide reductase [Sphingobacterium shayense]|uniref:TlpA family protein disulfide reductase n=1 Tax=Sphingobacterium shayense TaxID=626343 RepID=UPI0015570F8E|nr:TlpA disulfide reductase family protein [Sphingobacterium shayense]NQD71125.1 TlpA family protein disulfide reductase [Sphingobacterium shayense]
MNIHIKKIVLALLLIITGLPDVSSSIDAMNEKELSGRNIYNKKRVTFIDQPAPDLRFKDQNGKTISLNSLKGKVVFINLWATWCPPCIHEMPSINKLRETFKDNQDLVFLMVDMDGKIEKAKAFMKRKKFDLPVHILDSEIPAELFTGSIPTTIIVDKHNNVVGRQIGGADYSSQEVIDLIDALLNEE